MSVTSAWFVLQPCCRVFAEAEAAGGGRDVPRAWSRLSGMTWRKGRHGRKEPLLLHGVINHLKGVMTGTKDGAVPQPLPRGNGPCSGLRVRFIAELCWSRGRREHDFGSFLVSSKIGVDLCVLSVSFPGRQ